jgi:hypothetical protein
MRLLFFILLCCSFQYELRAQTFDMQELLPLLISGTKESTKEFFLKKGLSLVPVDKIAGTEKASILYSPMSAEHWFDKSGEQFFFEFEDGRGNMATSFLWDSGRKHIADIAMIRPRDSIVFEQQMKASRMLLVRRDREHSIFVSQDLDLVVLYERSNLFERHEMISIVRRDSQSGKLLPPLPKKFNKKKK